MIENVYWCMRCRHSFRLDMTAGEKLLDRHGAGNDERRRYCRLCRDRMKAERTWVGGDGKALREDVR